MYFLPGWKEGCHKIQQVTLRVITNSQEVAAATVMTAVCALRHTLGFRKQ